MEVTQSNKIIQPFISNMDKTLNGFRDEQQIGLFTFYQMQQRNQYPTKQNLSPFSQQAQQIKLKPVPKIFILNQNKQQRTKRRVHSVLSCQKQIDQGLTTRLLTRKINLKSIDNKYSQILCQKKRKVVDLTLDCSSSRRKNTTIKPFQSQRLQLNKKIKSICLKQQIQNEPRLHFHSVHLKIIPQINLQNAYLGSNKYLKNSAKKSQIIFKTQGQQTRVEQLQLVNNQNQKPFVMQKQSFFVNKLKINKILPQSLFEQIDKKRKKIVSEYKKMNLNKKIDDIFQLKVNDNPIYGLKKLPLKDLSWLT